MTPKLYRYASSLLAFLCLLTSFSCQERFVFDPDVPTLYSFKEQTAWDWVLTNPKNEFNYMKQAVELTGMQAEYSTNTEQRTFFLVRDAAWTSTTGLLRLLTGSQTGSLTTVNVDKLKRVLRYHIVPKFVDQGPDNLYILNQQYFFQTLLDGNEGRMSLARDSQYRINVNTSADLVIPPLVAANRKTTNTLLHNYVFKNGIAHLANSYLGLIDYSK